MFVLLIFSLFLQNTFPLSVKLMITLQTLKLDKTKIKEIPEEMGKLSKLVQYYQ